MEEKVNGIVLNGINYSENDKILNIFTLEKGVVSARIKGVKKAGAKLKFASEPFCFVEYVFSVAGDRRNVINASLIDSFYPIREDIVKFYCAGTAVEFVKKFLQEGMVAQNTFVLICNCLKELAYGDNPPETVCADFLYNALKLAGYGLNLQPHCECGRGIEGRVFFDYNSGTFRCLNCALQTDREINPITYSALIGLENGEKITADEGVKVLRLIDFYIHNKAEVKLNSLSELITLKTFGN